MNLPSASNSCGAIFDVARSRETIASLEKKISQPDFWQDQEQAQKVMQQRKVAEAVLASDAKLATMASDIDTYFHLAEEEKDTAQRDSLLKEIEREMTAADTYVSELETLTLLSGENDRLNAIMTIKPGAGGMESQDWAEMLLRMYLRWAEQKGFTATVMDLSYGGVALLLEKAEEVPNQFNAVLHVPILPPVRVVLRKAYTQPAGPGRARIGCAFVS